MLGDDPKPKKKPYNHPRESTEGIASVIPPPPTRETAPSHCNACKCRLIYPLGWVFRMGAGWCPDCKKEVT